MATGANNLLLVRDYRGVARDTSKTLNPVLRAVRAELLARRIEVVRAKADTNIVVKVIITDQSGRILVLKDAKSLWDDLPGGHVKQGESNEEGLRREVFEETGIRLGEVRLYRTQTLTKPNGGKMLLYKATVVSPAVETSKEHSAAVWVKRDELGQHNLGRYAKDVESAAYSDTSHHETVRVAAENIYRATALGWLSDTGGDLVSKILAGKVADALAFIGVAAAAYSLAMGIASQRAYQQASASLRGDLGIDKESTEKEAFDFSETQRQHAETFPTEIVEKVKEVILTGQSKDEDNREIARKVQETIEAEKEVKVEVIAGTMAQQTYGQAQMEAMRLKGFTEKRWLSMRDNRVRHSHELCDKQGAIPIDAKFVNGLLFPGEPDAPLHEVANCRCNLEPVGTTEEVEVTA